MSIIVTAWTSFPSGVSIANIGRSVPALAALISLFVGIAAGFAQISSTAKARRMIEWINSTIDNDVSNKLRQDILKKLRLSQEGRLIAAHYVPWWRFILLPMSVVVYLAATAYFKRHYSHLLEFWPFQILSIVGLICVSQITIGWYIERSKIKEYYCKGLPIRSASFFREVASRKGLTIKACALCWISWCVGYALFVKQCSLQFAALLILLGTCSLLLMIRFAWKGAHGELRMKDKNRRNNRVVKVLTSALRGLICQRKKEAGGRDVHE